MDQPLHHETPKQVRPKRSFSYNDLKKKRLMLSEKSRSKMKTIAEDSSLKQKPKHQSEIKNILSTIPQNQNTIKECIHQLKGVLSSLREKSHSKRMLSIRESLTERTLTQRGRYESQIILKSNNKANERSSLYNSIEDAGTAKELIKGIINKNKSQRKLTRLNEVRDRLKMQKERSKSHSKEAKEINLIQNNLKNIAAEKEKEVYKCEQQTPNGKVEARNIENTVVKSRQSSQKKTVKQIPHKSEILPTDIKKTSAFTRNKSIKEIQVNTIKDQTAPPSVVDQKIQDILNAVGTTKQSLLAAQTQITSNQYNNGRGSDSFEVNDISTIKDESRSKFDDSDFKMLSTQRIEIEGEQILDLLKVKTGELLKLNKCKQSKKKSELGRMKKIFPKDFFAF